MSAGADEWERHAGWWQEHFTQGADPEYEEQILPLVGDWLGGFDRVLEVGTGEGQVARRVAGAGASLVVGIEPARAQVVEAAQRGGGPRYVRALASPLPFAGGAFDAGVVCLVLEHIDEVEPVVAELARVLRPGARLLVLLNHPLLQTPDSGWIDDRMVDPPEQYWRIGAYLHETSVVEEVAKGVHIRFVHRPLHRYVNALLEGGFVVERLEEPPPPPGFVALAPEYESAASVPRLLVLVSRRT